MGFGRKKRIVREWNAFHALPGAHNLQMRVGTAPLPVVVGGVPRTIMNVSGRRTNGQLTFAVCTRQECWPMFITGAEKVWSTRWTAQKNSPFL